MSTPEPPPYPGEPTSGSSGDLPSYGSVPPPPGPPAGSPPPGSPPPPPPPTPASPGAFSAPEAVAWGWRKFSADVGPVVLGSLAFIGISLVLGVLTSIVTGASALGPGSMSPSRLGSTNLISDTVQATVNIVMAGVAAKAALEVADGQPYNFFAAFGKVNFGRLIVVALLVGLAVTVGFRLLFIPGIVIAFLTFLTPYSLVDDDKEPIDAIKHSYSLVTANFGDALLLALLNIVVVLAGLVALCVGVVVALPITVFATAYAYRSFTGRTVAG